jgi:hypothetical protein
LHFLNFAVLSATNNNNIIEVENFWNILF